MVDGGRLGSADGKGRIELLVARLFLFLIGLLLYNVKVAGM